MRIKLHKTLNKLNETLPADRPITFEMLEKADDLILRLRSQIIGIKYDMLDFAPATRYRLNMPAENGSQTEPKTTVSLIIPEPLPSQKELTYSMENHWVQRIQEAIAKEAQTGIPYFKKAFVLIRIYAPRGTNNAKVWDTSNRSVNMVINNLKGVFFNDDNFEHTACGIVADWSKTGMTEIRICDYEELKKCDIFR